MSQRQVLCMLRALRNTTPTAAVAASVSVVAFACLSSSFSSAIMGAAESVPEATSVFDFEVEDAGGEVVSLDKYRGNVLLVVNVASK